MNNDQELYELLRRRRNEIAKQKDVKPFMVLHNKVLKEAAAVKPANLNELAGIKGLGEKKIAKYGKFILKIVNEFQVVPRNNSSGEKIFSVSEFIDSINQVLIPRRAYLLHSWQEDATPRGSLSALIFDGSSWIFNHNKVAVFDFEGSVIQNVDYFFSGFNAEITPFGHVYWSNSRERLLSVINKSIDIPGRLIV